MRCADAEAVAEALTRTPRESVGTLGEELRWARKNAGYSTYTLAPLVGVHRTQLSRLEHDRLRPDMARVAEIARLTAADLPRLVAAYRR